MVSSKIGIFDSGFGGISVLKAVQLEMPYHPLLYLGDQAHVPYGFRPTEEVKKFSFGISRWMIAQGCGEIIIACNTASAAALYDLRARYPDIRFIGMQPAVKPAAKHTKTGRVGVIATPTTLDGDLYASVVERFASNITVMQSTCPGLVKEIEAGRLDSDETRKILENALNPMLTKGIDALVLGCTHYTFVMPIIRKIVGKHVRIIDPAPAVARQAARVIKGSSLPEAVKTKPAIYTTGDLIDFKEKLPNFFHKPADIFSLKWDENCQLNLA